MLPIFPFFCFGVQKIPKRWAILIALFVIGLNVIRGNFSVFFPMHYFRALSGLLCGFLVFVIANYIDAHTKENKSFFKRFASVLLFFPILLSVMNWDNNIVYLVYFIVGFAFGFSGNITNQMRIPVAKQLSEYSFLIYLVHLNIADLICVFSQRVYRLTGLLQYTIYFVMTGLAVICLKLFVTWAMSSLWRIKNKISGIKG